jgi:hypothetical protein
MQKAYSTAIGMGCLGTMISYTRRASVRDIRSIRDIYPYVYLKRVTAEGVRILRPFSLLGATKWIQTQNGSTIRIAKADYYLRINTMRHLCTVHTCTRTVLYVYGVPQTGPACLVCFWKGRLIGAILDSVADICISHKLIPIGY